MGKRDLHPKPPPPKISWKVFSAPKNPVVDAVGSALIDEPFTRATPQQREVQSDDTITGAIGQIFTDPEQAKAPDKFQELFQTDISQLPVKDIVGQDQPQGLINNPPEDNFLKNIFEMVKTPDDQINLGLEKINNQNLIGGASDIINGVIGGTALPFAGLDFVMRNVPQATDIITDILKLPSLGEIGADILGSPGTLVHQLSPIIRGTLSSNNPLVQTANSVENIIKEKYGIKGDNPEVVELGNNILTLMAYGGIFGLGSKSYKGLKESKIYGIEDNIRPLDVSKMTPAELHNEVIKIKESEQQNHIIQTLEKDKAEVQKQFEQAQTPEERLQAVNTLDKIEKKQAEYKEKNLPKKEKVTGNQPTRRATQEVPEQRSYEEVVDEFFQAKDNNEPYPLPKQSDLMDVQDKGKFNNLSYQISQHNLNLAKSTGDVSLINPEYVNTEFKNIKGQVKKFGVEPIKPKETSLKSESVEVPKVDESSVNLPNEVKKPTENFYDLENKFNNDEAFYNMPDVQLKRKYLEARKEWENNKDNTDLKDVRDFYSDFISRRRKLKSEIDKPLRESYDEIKNNFGRMLGDIGDRLNKDKPIPLEMKDELLIYADRIRKSNEQVSNLAYDIQNEYAKYGNDNQTINNIGKGIEFVQKEIGNRLSSPKSLPKPEPVKSVETKEVPVAVEKKVPEEKVSGLQHTKSQLEEIAKEEGIDNALSSFKKDLDVKEKRLKELARYENGRLPQVQKSKSKDIVSLEKRIEEVKKDIENLETIKLESSPTPKPKRTPKPVEQPKGEANLLEQVNKAVEDIKSVDVNGETPTVIASRLKELGYEIDNVKPNEFSESFKGTENRQRKLRQTYDTIRPQKTSNAYIPVKDIKRQLTEVGIGEPRIVFKDKKGTYKIPINNINEFKVKLEKSNLYEKAKKDLGKLPDKLSAFPVDYYAKQIKNLTTIGKYHIENGAKAFTKWAKEMVKDVGEWIRPKLRTLWNELTKDRTGLPDVVKQGADFDYSSFKRGGKRDVKAERKMIEDNLNGGNEPKTVHSNAKLNATTRQKVLASDIFTKGDKKAGKDVFNYDKFSTKEQLNDLVEQSAKENKPEIDAQKRDMRTWAKTSEGANILKAMGWDENSLMRAVRGDSFLAERILASKDFINTAGHELLKAMQELPKTADAKVELADKFMKYNVMVKNTKGLISEAGRALNIVKRKSSEDVRMKIDLAEELVRLGLEGDDIAGLDKALKIIDATAQDKIYYWWYNSMLSNPLTDVANIGGNVTHFSWELMQTALTENPRTTLKILQDIKNAHGTGIDEVKRIFRGQENTESKFDYKDRIYAEAFTPKSKFGKAVKSVLPTTRLAMEDAYFRNLAGGLRKYKTLREISKETGDSMAQVQSLLDAVYKNPELALLDKKFEVYEKHLKALERYIDFLVFQTPLGEGGKFIQHGINKIPVLKTTMPFMKIAVNLTKAGIRQTPYGLKDLVFKKDLTALEKKDVIRRAVLGSVFFAGIGKLMADDIIEITGHGVDDRDKRELWYKQGYRENHFYIKVNGEKYGFSYTNINPVNTLLSIIGSYSDDQKYNQTNKDAELNIIEKGTKALLGAVEVLTTQSFMQGMADTIDMIKNNDPEMIKKSLQNMFSPSILSFPRDVSNYIKGDKKQYETKTALDRLKDKTGLTDGLKPKLNQFGEEKTSSLQRFPYPVTKLKSDEPLTDFLIKNEIEIAYPNKNTKLGNDVMTEDQYYEYVKLSGPAIKKALSEKLTILNSFTTAEERDKATHLIVDTVREQVRENMKAMTKEEIEAKKKEDKDKREDNKDMKEKLGLKTEKKSTKSGKYKPIIIK